MKLDAEQIFLNIFISGFLQVDVNISEGHPVTFLTLQSLCRPGFTRR